MLQKARPGAVPTPITPSGRRGLWVLLALDVMTVAWMLALGDWFDRTSRLTSVVTLGGHHHVVLWLAAGSFVGLLVAAVLSDGFTTAGGVVRGVAAVAAGAGVVSIGGIVSCLALAGSAVIAATMLGRGFVR
jgi:hypothetical protein